MLNALLGGLLRLARRPPLEQLADRPGAGGGAGLALGDWVLYGLQIWVLAARLGAPAGKAALLAVGGFAFAWCVGFLVVFAPAGAVIREVVLVALLGPMLGVSAATAVALMSRVLMTAGDLITAGVAALSSRLPGSRAGGGMARENRIKYFRRQDKIRVKYFCGQDNFYVALGTVRDVVRFL